MYKRTLLAMSSSFMKDKMWNRFGIKNRSDATEATDFSTVHHYGTTSCVKRLKEAFRMCWNKLRLCHTNKYSLPNIFLKTHGRSGRSCLSWSLKETLSKSLMPQAWITAWLDHFAVPNYTSWLKGKKSTQANNIILLCNQNFTECLK